MRAERYCWLSEAWRGWYEPRLPRDPEFWLLLVARIPYPSTIPKAYVVASEAASMEFLRLKGLPIPKVLGYSFTTQNEADTEYILMEHADGDDLSQTWFDLRDDDIVSVMTQLAKIEFKMMSISFPAGGSIYYAHDLKELSGSEGVALDEKSFCIGPDVSAPLWYGRRAQLDVFRGPCVFHVLIFKFLLR